MTLPRSGAALDFLVEDFLVFIGNQERGFHLAREFALASSKATCLRASGLAAGIGRNIDWPPMNNSEDATEEAKKIAVRPRQFREAEPAAMETVELVPEPPRAGDFLQESPNPPSPARKRPSHTLRPADSGDSTPDEYDQPPSTVPPSTRSPAENPAPDSRRSSRGKRSKGGLATPVPLGVALALAIVLTVLAGFYFYSAGSRAGFQEAESAAIKENVELTPEFLARLDRALSALQAGNGAAALGELKALEAEEPDVATLSLLMANAALLSGDASEASKRISESIDKRESVSDSLTLQAIVEAKLATDSDYKKMGSPKVRIEQLLRQAIAADASNARPYFELATLKRFEQKHDEALDLLRSAQCRLQAADSRAVTDTAIALTELQKLPDGELKPVESPAPVPEEMFAAAYVSMRQGDFAKASATLETARGLFPDPLFRQILKDPAFQPYTKETALADFFKTPAQPAKK
jgi:hypothetical protein